MLFYVIIVTLFCLCSQSNDNMELLTHLQTEQHATRDVQVKLASQEDELKKFHEVVSIHRLENNFVLTVRTGLIYEDVHCLSFIPFSFFH